MTELAQDKLGKYGITDEIGGGIGPGNTRKCAKGAKRCGGVRRLVHAPPEEK